MHIYLKAYPFNLWDTLHLWYSSVRSWSLCYYISSCSTYTQ